MKPESVAQLLDLIISDYSVKLSDKEKSLKSQSWEIALENVPRKQAWSGYRKLLDMSRPFMPTAGEFKQLCISGDGCGTLEDQAMIAWDLVKRNLNHTISPLFKDSSIAETIRGMGGWRTLCNMLESEAPFKRKEFLSSYLVYKRRGLDYPPMLSGSFDEPKFIGFNENDDTQAVLEQVKTAKANQSKMLELAFKGVEIGTVKNER